MSALTDKIAAEHELETYSTHRGDCITRHARCTCGVPLTFSKRDAEFHVHLLEAVEAAVRAQIAADIEAVDPVEWALAGQDAGKDAAQIAKGGA